MKKYACNSVYRLGSDCGTECCYSCVERDACKNRCWSNKDKCRFITEVNEHKGGNVNVNDWWNKK